MDAVMMYVSFCFQTTDDPFGSKGRLKKQSWAAYLNKNGSL